MATVLVQLAIGIGGLLLTALFTPKPKDQYGSRLSDINVTPVSPGQVVPRVWGTMKVPAQMIFCSPLIETMHTHQASKKGGGKGGFGGNSAKTFTFTYSIDAAWGICGGPVYGVNRIWANQKLLYVSPQAQANSQATFDAAYQSEATRLIYEEGVQVDHAAASAFVFAFNNYDTAEVTLSSPSDAVNYIMDHDIVMAGHPTLVPGQPGGPDSAGVTYDIIQMYSGLNNQSQYQSQINRFDQLEIYLGDEAQAANGLLQGYLGMGNAPAFRGLCYVVIQNLQLMDFGNSVPSITVEVSTNAAGTTSLREVITNLCIQSGLDSADFDAVSQLAPTPFPGFCITTNTSARQVLQDLQKIFPFDAAESGYQIIFSMLNKKASQTLDRNDFAAHVDSEQAPPTEEITRVTDYDLPQRINLKYQEPARNYSINQLYAARWNTESTMVEDIEVTIALDRLTAQTSVQNTLMTRMTARRVYKIKMPRKYITLQPTDVVKAPNKANPNFLNEYYVTQVDVGANGILDVQMIDHLYIDPNVNPSDRVSTDLQSATGGNTSLPSTCETLAFLLDCPLLTDTATDGPGFYVVLAGAFNEWQGGNLYVDAAAASVANAYGLSIVSASSGSSWEAVASSSINVPQGVCLSALSPGVVSCYWDTASSLLVHINNTMDLTSATEDAILQQSLNVAYIGGEVVQYANATNLGNGLWTLTNFLRGLRGTERFINGHVTGEGFIALSSAMLRIPTTKAELNISDTFQTISLLTGAPPPASFTFSDTGNSFRPYTVYVYQKFRNADGDVTVSWWPRVRQNGQWLSGSDVTIPANDSPETYSVDILASDLVTVKATYPFPGTAAVALGAVFVYTTTMQTADYGSPQATVYMAIYQVSNVIGRGFGIGVAV